jgi:hypothetical protein
MKVFLRMHNEYYEESSIFLYESMMSCDMIAKVTSDK